MPIDNGNLSFKLTSVRNLLTKIFDVTKLTEKGNLIKENAENCAWSTLLREETEGGKSGRDNRERMSYSGGLLLLGR